MYNVIINTLFTVADLLLAIAILILLLKKRTLYFPQIYHFSRHRYLLSPTEQVFYRLLNQTFSNVYYIFPQVHLDQLIRYRIRGTSRRGPFRHVDIKHVDFVLCDKNTFEPVLAVEFDEVKHEGGQLAEDKMVEDLLNNAHIPFVRIRHTDPPNLSLISEKIHDALAGQVL